MIYVHVPFCKSFCIYCGFYSETASCYGRYVEALCREVALRSSEIAGTMDVNTLYVGGGTPSVMPLLLLSRMAEAVREAAGGRDFDEFTVELNPEDVVEKGEAYAEGLLEMGVNRVSMGVQSFDDGVLRWMNRRHNSEGAVRAYRILERAGFENISIDLIFGLPSVRNSAGLYVPLLPDGLWKETLEKALEISASGKLPSHISAYQLSVEPDSALERMIASGRCSEAPDEDCARQYDILCSTLTAAGYTHYEISNFALPGHEAKHNSAYWRHQPYCGFGPGAHSLRVAEGEVYERSWNAPELEAYLSFYGPANSDGVSQVDVREGEVLSAEQVGIENVMLGLRTAAGCREDLLRAACKAEQIELAVSSGHLVRVEPCSCVKDSKSCGFFRIPEKHFFISDSIISDLLA